MTNGNSEQDVKTVLMQKKVRKPRNRRSKAKKPPDIAKSDEMNNTSNLKPMQEGTMSLQDTGPELSSLDYKKLDNTQDIDPELSSLNCKSLDSTQDIGPGSSSLNCESLDDDVTFWRENEIKSVKILSDDKEPRESTLSCICVGCNYLFIGTTDGTIIATDLQGNIMKKIKVSKDMNKPVKYISANLDDSYISVITIDNTYIIKEFNGENVKLMELSAPNATVCVIDPYFKHNTASSSVVICFSDGNVSEYSEGILFSYSKKTIHVGQISATCIGWKNDIIIWTDSKSVYLYEAYSNKNIISISISTDIIPEPDDNPSIYWVSPENVYICMGNQALEYKISKTPNRNIADFSKKYYLDFVSISHIAKKTFTLVVHDKLVISLCRGNNGSGLSLEILSGFSDEQLITINILDESCYVVDGKSAWHNVSHMAFIIYNNSLIILRFPTLLDTIKWLYEKGKYHEILESGKRFLKCPSIKNKHERVVLEDVFFKCILEYMNRGEYKYAASVCSSLVDHKNNSWDTWIRLFISYEKTQGSVYKYKETYEALFRHLVKTDIEVLNGLISAWPENSYDVDKSLQTAIEVLKCKGESRPLLKLITKLYTIKRQYPEVIYFKLLMGDNDCLTEVNSQSMYDLIEENVFLVMKADEEYIESLNHDQIIKLALDTKSIQSKKISECSMDSIKIRVSAFCKGVKFLVANTEKLQVDRVVEKLSSNKKYLHIYLIALFMKDKSLSEKFHHIQPELYALYDSDGLIDFLKSTTHYSLERTRDLCNKMNLVDVRLYLLERTEGEKSVMNTIISELNDWKRAVDYAKVKSNPELWSLVLDHSVNNQQLISELLYNASLEIGLHKIVECIKDDTLSPKLSKAFLHALSKCESEIAVNNCQKDILALELIRSVEKLKISKKTGLLLESTHVM